MPGGLSFRPNIPYLDISDRRKGVGADFLQLGDFAFGFLEDGGDRVANRAIVMRAAEIPRQVAASEGIQQGDHRMASRRWLRNFLSRSGNFWALGGRG